MKKLKMEKIEFRAYIKIRLLILSMTLKDSSEHIQECLMTYYGACDGNMEPHDGVVRLCRIRIIF